MSESNLKRTLTLPDVVALGINGVVGQGIFLLPGLAAASLGPASIAALALAGVLCFLIALCFAEVGSRFSSTGGAYIYARSAFGDFVGFEVGWMTCCVAVISWAALANGFTVVLAHFIPGVDDGLTQKLICVGMMGGLAGINMFGAKAGARVSTFFSIAKLIPLVLFIGVGLCHLDMALFTPFAPHGTEDFASTTLMVMYAYVGFETLVVPAGEMANPQRAVPLAMLTVMALVSVIYILVMSVSVGTLPELAGHGNPVAAASRGFMGPIGGTIVALGIVVSVFGTNAGAALVSPRRFYALAERGDLPAILAKTSPKTGAPVPAIVTCFALSALLSLTGTFKELAILAVVARFLQYIPTCLATIILRRREGAGSGGFRIPFGPVLPVVSIVLCLWLMANTQPDRLIKGGIAVAVGVPLYFLARYSRGRET
ncbi:MAG: amino acid transporter [Myxococcota bacterium]|jgi:amino acid transporter